MERKQNRGMFWLVIFLALALVCSLGFIVYDKVYQKNDDSMEKEESNNPSENSNLVTNLEKEDKIQKQVIYGAYIDNMAYSPSYDASLDKYRIHYQLAVYIKNNKLVGEGCEEVYPFDDEGSYFCSFKHNLNQKIKSLYYVSGIGNGPSAFIFLLLTEDGDLYKWDAGGEHTDFVGSYMKTKIDEVSFSKIPLDVKINAFYLGKRECTNELDKTCNSDSFSVLLVETEDHHLFELDKDYKNSTVTLGKEYLGS